MMSLQDGFPSASGLADANDVRLALAGLIIRDSSGNPRTGIFPRHTNALVTSTATMNSSVAAFEAAVSRSGQGVILLPNNGATNVLHDPAPVANSRYDTIYVKQNDSVSPNADANNLPVFGILKGTPSASPTLPTRATAQAALDAAPGIGAGAEPLTAVLIPSTATNMQSSGVVYTQLYQYTAAAGGVVPFRTKTEMNLWVTPGLDQKAIVGGLLYTWDGSSWVSVTAGTATAGVTVTLNPSTKLTRDSSGMVTLNLFAVRSSGNFAINDVIAAIPVGFRPEVPVDGSILGSGFAFPGVVAAGIRIYDNGNALFVGPASQNTFIGTATYKALV